MNEKLNRKTFAVGLIELIDTAIAHRLMDEAGAVLAGLRVLRPRLVELDVLEARIAMRRRQFEEAIHLLRNAESSPTHWSLAKAMMACCQKQLHDPAWQMNADEVLRASQAMPEALDMVALLQGTHTKPSANHEATTNSTAPYVLEASASGYPLYLRA